MTTGAHSSCLFGAMCVFLAGCAADPASGDTDGGADAGPGADASACSSFDPDPIWLDGYQRDVVARLSGAAEIAPGVVLSDRATVFHRDAARDYLASALAELGVEAELDEYGGGANVFGELGATIGDDAPVVILGAHFDSVVDSPGANDNATGVAAALAVLRSLGELSCRSKSLVVVFFDEEELGLLGSAAFAQKLVSEDRPVASVHTLDQLGWDDDGDRIVELEQPTAELSELYQGAALDLGLTVSVTGTGGTDHVAFRERGFDAVGVTEEFAGGDTTPHYHQASDVAATVDHDYLASSTELVRAAVAEQIQ